MRGFVNNGTVCENGFLTLLDTSVLAATFVLMICESVMRIPANNVAFVFQ